MMHSEKFSDIGACIIFRKLLRNMVHVGNYFRFDLKNMEHVKTKTFILLE